MIDLSLMSKQEKLIISGLLAGIFLLLIVFITPANMRQDKQKSAPANVLSSGGGPGDGPGYFNNPKDISLDSSGNIYIVDSRNNRIQKFNDQGVFLMDWGKQGDKPGEFKEPCGIDIGPDDKIYVADTWNGRIQVFTDNGKFLLQMGKENGLWGPRDVAVDNAGNVYVSNTGFGKIEKFDSKGKFLMTIGEKGEGKLQFDEPFGLMIGPDNNLYVLDRKNFRVQVVSETGKYIREFKVDGWAKEQYVDGRPMEPYLDINQNKKLIYITDSTNQRVLRYNMNGTGRKIFHKDEQGMEMFSAPLSVAVGKDGRIYVTDTGLGRLITFMDKN